MEKPATQRRASSKVKRGKRTSRSRSTSNGTAIRTYRSAINFLNARTNYEKMVRVGYNSTNFNLSRMNRILAGLGNPHKQLRCVHIAGTKGKGSTAHMLAAMLQHGGKKIGLYTSPHFVELRERIQIDAQMISEAEFARVIAQIAPVADKLEKEGPTFFELVTAAAMLHFVEQQVDFAILETGLGGRLDSTNVVKPEVCAITSISYDHTQQLGNTLELIAEEKAGIFKPGVPIISASQPAGVKRVLKEAAEKVGAPLKFVGDDLEFSYRFECSHTTGPHSRVCMATKTSRFDHVRVPLAGEHQAENCAIALGLVDALREQGVEIAPQDAIDGLAKVSSFGRMQTIRRNPQTIVDGAHNAASIRALMRAIGQHITYDSMVVIFACSADKDIDGMLKQIQLGADKVIFTSTGTPRSADPHELQQRFQELSPKMAQVEERLEDAFRIAMHCVTREDLICITGSVYIAGAAMQKLDERVLPTV